ncbi:DNA double-strand break repair rad50 ATPase [Ectocarpus siliculosus]|uniref:DNA double-strand break repair rad50 ATPase n=1 Tax=Ectocarpus siliculosus TaxID=2880 RepID=D7FQ73_ECTSI|nr:DNA double-strand break repair rad50 ATPase [Ectocarpus siliculosus]|eukprot:CBJ48405.1 DNA double-strand break repair rad50 ATPase [Ectocarpus siliculosus]
MRDCPQAAVLFACLGSSATSSMLSFVGGMPGTLQSGRCRLPRALREFSRTSGLVDDRHSGGVDGWYSIDRSNAKCEQRGRRNQPTLYALASSGHRRQGPAIPGNWGGACTAPIVAPPARGSTRAARRGLGGFSTSTEMKAAKDDTTTRRPKTPEDKPTMSSAAIVAGTRVRLLDTGRLGTVVGKAGGWWKVDLLESWGGGGGGGAASGKALGTEADAASRPSGPVSTRRMNMEPLGNAYASPSTAAETSAGTSAAVEAAVEAAAASPAAKTPAAKRRRSASTKRNGKTKEVAAAPGSAAATAVAGTGGKAVARGKGTKAGGKTTRGSTGVVPPSLAGRTISLQASPPSAAAALAEKASETATTAVFNMSADGLAHATMKEWLVFSDLHVSPASLAVSLEVLDRVNEEAMKRSACGIAFLGDFWHARGSLKVDLLVPVMEHLATWTRPVVMIPGNHDQVTLGGGMHALTPLQFAFTDPMQALVLSEPTLFLGALWIPHRRNNTEMEGLLGSDEARGAGAIFCHVDIKGAAMNGDVSSHSGIPRSAFPPNVPAFSGHVHKPHTLGGRDGFIRYVGSPYQTALSESGQSKALIVLDAETWEEKELVPLDIGRRFFRVKGAEQPLPEVGEVSPGDRVVWTVKDAGSDDVRQRAGELMKEMVEVEIREKPRPFPPFTPFLGGAGGNGTAGLAAPAVVAGADGANSFPVDSAGLSPDVLFGAYLEREREGGGRNVSKEVEELGFSLIKGLGQQAASKERGREDRHTSLALHSIQLKNFGPFRDEITYPLDERGVVLLRGSNLDDSGADSNGAGKTTLAMSALWALAGVVDARPVSDGRVADVVHEVTRALSPVSSASSATSTGGNEEGSRRSAVAEVTLTATLNGKPLWLKRRKGARVNQLFLKHDGKDLTRQIAKETQVVLEDELGLSSHVLGRGIFQGQHHLNGLLESTDAQLKEDLALLVPMDLWQDLASRSRVTARKSDEEAAVTRREDLARLTEELQRARREAAAAAATSASGAPTASTSAGESDAPIADVAEGKQPSKTGTKNAATAAADGVNSREGGDSKEPAAGATDVDTAVAALEEEAAGGASGQARLDARRARDDAEVAEEALRLLRLEVEELARGWTDQRMRLLGEAKAAQERVSFLRRDVQRSEAALADSERAELGVKEKLVLLRKRDPDLWAELASINRSGGESPDQTAAAAALAASREVERAEGLASSSRASLADAQAALRHAAEAVQAHAGLEVVGKGACHTCGQPVSPNIIHERGEILRVSQTVAEAQLTRSQREATVARRSLELARDKADLVGELGRLEREQREALGRKRESGEELRARRDELRRAEHGATAAESKMEEQSRREAALRREWEGKTKAAEWALKALRDKQTFAQHELAEAVAREAELQLRSQAEQAEQERLLQAKEVALSRVREIETQAERLRKELSEVEKKEKDASAHKATSTALAEHLGMRGVQNFVFRDAVNQLEANVARYLDALSDGALQLHLPMEGDRVVKRASVRAADGRFRDRSLSQLSGGQWRRASLALELAFIELARQRGRFSCNLLVLDEVLSQLDSYGRERVASMLRALTHGRNAGKESDFGPTHAMYSTILVILQDLPSEELQESFDAIDQVVKQRDSSSVVVGPRLQ